MKGVFIVKSVFILVFLRGYNSFSQQKKWTLRECVDYALEKNISIRQAALDNEIAKIDKREVVGKFLPSASVGATHSWNIGLTQNIVSGLLKNETTPFTSFNGSIGVDIYKGLQIQNALRRANLEIIANQYKLLQMQENVALNIANAFLQILFNKENLKVQKEQLVIDNKQIERMMELINSGVVPRGDLLDIKATVAADEQKVINAENVLLISKLSLAQLLQLKDFADFDVIDEINEIKESVVMTKSPATIYEKAKQERTELKVAQYNLKMAEKDVAISKGAYQPTLQGFYNFNTRIAYSDVLRPQLDGSFVNEGVTPFWSQFTDNKGHSFGLQLNVPIFNRFNVRNNVDRSRVALKHSILDYEQTKLDLERNVYTAFTDAKGALKSYEAAVSAVDARKEALRYARERFEVGLMHMFEFSQAQTLYVNAQSEELRTKYDYIFRVKILEFYFGIPIIQKQ